MSGRSTYAESKPFVDALQPHKRRKPTQPKPGARKPPETLLHVVEDPSRGVALVRGLGVLPILESAGVEPRARWSESARGWVVDVADLADVIAAADWARATVRTKALGGAQ